MALPQRIRFAQWPAFGEPLLEHVPDIEILEKIAHRLRSLDDPDTDKDR